MAGAFDSLFGGLAKSLIGTFGTAGTLIIPGDGEYDPETGETTAGAEVEIVVKCSPPERYRKYDIDGTRIRTGDMRVTVARLDYETLPAQGVRFRFDGQMFAIISVHPISSGNYEAAWELQLRFVGLSAEATPPQGGGSLDAVFASLTPSLIGSFGTTGIITTTTGGSYNPATGEATAGTEVETTVKCSPPEMYSQYDIDGTRILSGDMKVMVAVADYQSVPEINGWFAIRGGNYKIISVSPVYSGNKKAAWEMQLRRAYKRVECVYEAVTVGGEAVTVEGEAVTVRICA